MHTHWRPFVWLSVISHTTPLGHRIHIIGFYHRSCTHIPSHGKILNSHGPKSTGYHQPSHGFTMATHRRSSFHALCQGSFPWQQYQNSSLQTESCFSDNFVNTHTRTKLQASHSDPRLLDSGVCGLPGQHWYSRWRHSSWRRTWGAAASVRRTWMARRRRERRWRGRKCEEAPVPPMNPAWVLASV